MTDLSLESTEALKAELEKRFDTGIILLNRSRSADLAETDYRWWGNRFENYGLLRGLQLLLERELVDHFDCDGPGDHEQ